MFVPCLERGLLDDFIDLFVDWVGAKIFLLDDIDNETLLDATLMLHFRDISR